MAIDTSHSENFDGVERETAQLLLSQLASFLASAPVSSDAPSREPPDITARYKTLVEQIPAVIFMAFLDHGLSEAYVSPHIETILGFTQEQWLDDPVRWYSHIHPDDRTRWSVEAAQLILNGQPLRSVYRVIARDGRVVWFHCHVKIVFTEDGRPWFIHGAAFDITELKEAEIALQQARDELEAKVQERTAELAQANRSLEQEIGQRKRAQAGLAQVVEELKRSNSDLEQFAYSASHDLQEPLRMVAIYSQMIQRRFGGKLGATGEEFISHITTGVTRMEQLLADLRAFLRASTTDQTSTSNADPGAALSRALTSLSAAIESSGATVTHGLLPDQVFMRQFQLEQLFQNLIGNAIHYRSEKSPRVHVSAEACGDLWKFCVRDNGIGIPSEYKEQIFGMFKRLHSWYESPGTGMGLAICKRIVERSGGRIWVESEAGQGSAFFFTVPGSQHSEAASEPSGCYALETNAAQPRQISQPIIGS